MTAFETVAIVLPVTIIAFFAVAFVLGTVWRTVRRAFWRKRLSPIIED